MRNEFVRRVGPWALLVGATAIGAGACGARSEISKKGPGDIPECIVDADCEGFDNKCRNVRCTLVPDDGSGGSGTSSSSSSNGSTGTGTSSATGGLGNFPLVAKCVEGVPVDCDDGDVCTIDKCEPESGECVYTDAAVDLDKDGVKGPREGATWTDPIEFSCGNDCDDTNDQAFPGNPNEPCDGVDNNCNGIVDDNMTFVPYSGAQEKQISAHASADTGGLAYNGTNYAALFTESRPPPESTDMFRSMLTGLGDQVPPGQERVTAVNGDSFAGPVLWIGDRFGVVWSDRRDSDYEIYFTELDEKGTKIRPDQRLTNAPEFSIYPDLAFTGNHFITVWQDERSGLFDIYGQVLDLDGNLVGGNVPLTKATTVPNEAPAIAATSAGIGVAWTHNDTFVHIVMFQRFDFDLNPIGDPIELTDGTTEAVYPTIAFNKDRYIVAWADKSAFPKAIYATVIGLDGTVLVPPTAVTNPGSFRSRYPTLRALGDRTLLVYSDDRDGGRYELYSRVFDNDLQPISAEFRVTNAPEDSIKPKITFGPDGDVGVLFRDDRTGEQQVWFTRLKCQTTITP